MEDLGIQGLYGILGLHLVSTLVCLLIIRRVKKIKIRDLDHKAFMIVTGVIGAAFLGAAIYIFTLILKT